MSGEPAIVGRVRQYLAAHRPPPGPVVVAVSGGPDSVALLRCLHGLGDSSLIAAHMNHSLRGQGSNDDEAFVRNLADRLGVEFRSVRRDIATQTAGDNLEAAARRIRYEWLAELAHEAGSGWVATGHTADDQAETVLFHLLRGTGLDGLAGIASRRPLDSGVELVRPLLAVPRRDVIAYLGELGQDFRTDRSNADTTRSRSRIRHELLPLLVERFQPRAVEHLARLASQAADWRREQALAAEALMQLAERPRAGSLLVFDRRTLAKAPRRRRRLLWRTVWRREGWPRQEMGFREWDRLAAMCRGGPTALDLPGGIRVRRRGSVIQIGPMERGR